MKEEEIDLVPSDPRTLRQPGETLQLAAMWSLKSMPKTLEARLFWFTRGKGTEDVEVVEEQKVPVMAAEGEYQFRFTLPSGPYAFAGKLITLTWAVEFIAGYKTARWEFSLGPSNQRIVLGEVTGIAPQK